VGICAVTEAENTLQIAGQILTMYDPGLSLRELIIATPNKTLATALENRDKRLVVVFEDHREGKAPALNKILQRATGDILVLASADIKLGRSSIPRLVHTLSNNDSWGAVDSRVEIVNGDTRLMDRVSSLVWEVHNEMLDTLDGDGRLGHVAGDLLAVRRNLLKDIPNTINDDAYIAVNIKRQGYAVHRVQNALVWIAGPRNPVDYVSQRSRILQGHLQLIKDFGAMPTTFEFTLMWKPFRNLRVLNRVLSRFGPSYLPTLFAALFLEFVSFQAAILQLFTRRKYRPWRVAESTKRV